MQHMNDKCKEWKAKENIDFSLYGTPLESTTYKFAKCLQKRFGVIPGVTDKNYITNSYHVHVSERIDAFTKLKFESEFQQLSPGGAISYVEVPNMQNNIPAVLAVMQYIYDNIMYAELNTRATIARYAAMTARSRSWKTRTETCVGMPALPQPRSDEDERCAPYLRLYRNAVLEPGQNAGNQGPCPAPVIHELRRNQKDGHCGRRGGTSLPLRFRLQASLQELLQQSDLGL